LAASSKTLTERSDSDSLADEGAPTVKKFYAVDLQNLDCKFCSPTKIFKTYKSR
jgi:hypothetical protein